MKPPATIKEAERRNEQARATAEADPLRTAERLAALPWLAERLAEWPDPWPPEHVEAHPGPALAVEVRATWAGWRSGEDATAPAHVDRPAPALARDVADTLDLFRGAGELPEGPRTLTAKWVIEALGTLPEAPGHSRPVKPFSSGLMGIEMRLPSWPR